jgi:death on curing protein
MNFISLVELLEIHDEFIKATGGSQGARDIGRLEAALATQRQEVFNKQVYPTIHAKAAAIMRGIICDHPFVDGNKRTGMVAALTLLKMNGYIFSFDKGEIEDFAVKVAVEKLDVPEIAEWLKAKSRKSP